MRAQDAAEAAGAGADAIGLIFYPKVARFITPELAREIIAALPPFVTPVGLFVDDDVTTIRRIAETLSLATVQLHGEESPEQVDELKPLRVIKAIRVDRARFGGELRRWQAAVAALELTNLAGIVTETAGTTQAGGTGVANDWGTVTEHVKAGDFTNLPPLIAAGGLTPENVATVIRQIRPSAVDVSSGVESRKGEKSAAKIESFIRAVREADAEER